MKRFSQSTISALTLTLFVAYAHANDEEDMESMVEDEKGWQFLAGKHEDFVFEPTLSLMLGLADSEDVEGGAVFSWGLEASFNCPLLQPSTNKIRQQVSYFEYSDADSTIQSFEINPHYVVDVMDDLWIGAGPGFGYVRAEVDGNTANMAALQLGASIHYNIDKIFIGGEARYQFTTEDDIGDKKNSGADNWRTALKVGFNF